MCSGSISITSNGSHTVTGKVTANVNVAKPSVTCVINVNKDAPNQSYTYTIDKSYNYIVIAAIGYCAGQWYAPVGILGNVINNGSLGASWSSGDANVTTGDHKWSITLSGTTLTVKSVNNNSQYCNIQIYRY